MRGRAVAVLYADSAGLDSESINLEALETLVTVAGMAVELLSVARTAPKKAAEVEGPAHAPAEEVQPSYQPASQHAEPPAPVAAEPSFSGADTVESYETTYEQTYEPTYEATPVEPEAFVEAVPVEEPAGLYEDTAASAETPAPVEEPPAWSPPADVAPTGASRRRFGQDAELPVEVYSDEERRLHNDARRFARLLIS